MKLKMIVAAVAVTVSAGAFAKGSMHQQVQEYQQNGSLSFATDSELSYQMLNNQEVTGSALKILHARQSGEITPNVINIGGKGEVYAVYRKVDSKSNSAVYPSNEGSSTTAIKFPFFDLSFTGAVGDWTSAYIDLRASDVSSSDIKLPMFTL